MNAKRLLALLLCLCMVMICAGCADSGNDDNTTAVDATIEPTEIAETPEPEPVTATPMATADVQSTPEPTLTPEEEALREEEEQEIVVDELVKVDDLKTNDELNGGDWMNILLLGGDARGVNAYGRTDSIIILSINSETMEAKMTSIMRDTWVSIYGKGEQKINAANVYGGPELTIRTVNECFGMNIEKYVLVNMVALAKIIDAVGGIEVPEVTEAQMKALNQQMIYDAADFKLEDSTPLKECGQNIHLTGNQALAFARIRYLDSDYARVERQRTVLIAIAQSLKNMGASTALGMIPTLSEYVETNLEMNDLVMLAGVGLKLDMDKVEQLRIPADGTYQSGRIDGIWKIIADLEANEKLLHEFIYGADE